MSEKKVALITGASRGLVRDGETMSSALQMLLLKH